MAPQEIPTSDKESDPLPRKISITINQRLYRVGRKVPPWTTMIDFIRDRVKLPGTKVLCREGGCGVCTVVATAPDQENPGSFKTFSVQACQLLVYACAGWSFETIEFLGNRFDDYNPIQKALTGFYGTQCGYCSPGMIMTMHGQMKSSGQLTAEQVERALDGNICRCTGYRPILDAFKSFAEDGDQKLKDKLADIEDAYKAKCPKSGTTCNGRCGNRESESCTKSQEIELGEDFEGEHELSSEVTGTIQWYRPATISGIENIMKKVPAEEKVYLVVGNTGQGVYKDDGPFNTYISTFGVEELYSVKVGSPLVLGANVSIARAIEVFKHVSAVYSGYHYLTSLVSHWKIVANVAVRNVGSWAGNLMLKHKHPEFPSDIFLTLLAADAQLTLRDALTSTITQVDLDQFLKTDMSRSLIVSVTIPPIAERTQFRTFKIAPRTVNAHAYVNACIKMELDPDDGFKVTRKPTILFGGINPTFIHARQTEDYLLNKRLTEVMTVVEAAKTLGNEMNPDSDPRDASPEFRQSLAQSLLYKAVVGFLGNNVGGEILSGGTDLIRPLSSSQQDFDMNKETWPVGEGIPKVESTTQISGEAVYLDDIPSLPNELHGAFVHATYANAKIKAVDASAAMSVPGVVSYVSAADIPGTNSFVVYAGALPDTVFAEERVKYAGQSIGLIVAKNRDTAVRAAKLVSVEYEDIKKPILTIQEALKISGSRVPGGDDSGKTNSITFGDFAAGLKDSKHQVIGELSQGSQFHLTMEPIAGRVVPIEDGYDVFSTTQWPTEAQATFAKVLNVPVHSVNVSVRRLGGGYGGKISRGHVVSTAAAVAARKLKRPVRVVTDLHTNMKLVGWREPYMSKYEVGFDDNGVIKAMKVDMISDGGYVANETSVGFLAGPLQNTYYIPNILFRPIVVKTDTAANTWCRTPGTVEAVATIENIMEHIANYLKKDPLEVRVVNMVPPQVPRLMAPAYERNVVMEDILPLLKQKSMYKQRKEEIKIFNTENLWKKRGISIVPLRYGYNYPSMFRYGVQVVIYEHDGTVAVSHGGIEMGQGVNTKVAQVVAHTLKVPVESVIIKASDTMIGANSMVTGGSFTSDLCAHGARVASEALHKRFEAVRKAMKKETGEDPTWIQLVQKCHTDDVDISERYWTAGKDHPEPYSIWGACCLEVEIDVLTGQYLFRRADIVEDCGRSLNPYVDIGQVEGAFIMGLGLYTSEVVRFNSETGQKVSDSTWNYKPPTAMDIPVDMRITLLPNAVNLHGVLGSKATGEPALCLSSVVITALRDAIAAFRMENGNNDWFAMDTPITVEKVHQLCGVTPEQFKLASSNQNVLQDFQLITKDQVPAEDDTSCSLN